MISAFFSFVLRLIRWAIALSPLLLLQIPEWRTVLGFKVLGGYLLFVFTARAIVKWWSRRQEAASAAYRESVRQHGEILTEPRYEEPEAPRPVRACATPVASRPQPVSYRAFEIMKTGIVFPAPVISYQLNSALSQTQNLQARTGKRYMVCEMRGNERGSTVATF